MPGNKHWAQCQFSSGFSCVSLFVEFLPIHIQRRLWSSVMVNRTPVPTTILCLWSHMFWERKKIIWVRGSPIQQWENSLNHPVFESWVPNIPAGYVSSALTLARAAHKHPVPWDTSGKNLGTYLFISSIRDGSVSSLRDLWLFLPDLAGLRWLLDVLQSRLLNTVQIHPRALWKHRSLNEQVFFIFPLYIALPDFFFFSLLCMLLQMLCCNLYLLLLRHWQNSNLSRAVSTFQCNKVRSSVYPSSCFEKSIL